jgi:hypothetical protein
MVLPRPRLPQTVHDITIDNLPSRPIATQHSWTYPGFGCGVVLRPQFAPSVLYSQAQQIAFYKSTHAPQVTGPLIGSAGHETPAVSPVRWPDDRSGWHPPSDIAGRPGTGAGRDPGRRPGAAHGRMREPGEQSQRRTGRPAAPS